MTFKAKIMNKPLSAFWLKVLLHPHIWVTKAYVLLGRPDLAERHIDRMVTVWDERIAKARRRKRAERGELV